MNALVILAWRRLRSCCSRKFGVASIAMIALSLSRPNLHGWTAFIRRVESGLVLLAASYFLLAAAHTAAAAEIRNVLIVHSYNWLLQGDISLDRGLRAGIASTPDHPVEIFSEFLDYPKFLGATFEGAMTSYLREKYAARPPDAIIAVSDEALDFMSRHRSQLFPSAALIHTAVSKLFLGT